jgi:glycosyltransferase involved in cell wall biosynthesis
VVIRINNTITEELRVARGLVARVIRPFGVRRLYPQADGIIAVSQGASEGLRQAFGDFGIPIEVIPNPVVIPELYEWARQPLEHPWFSHGEPPVLVTMGRLVPQKDLVTLIRAFALVRDQTRARLLILGEGEERPRLEHLIKDQSLEGDVQLPGFVSNPFPLVAAARGVILSSRYEGAPSVVVEALALGTPVAATDCPSGPREMLQNGRWGRLVPIGDVPALAAAMLEILRGSPYPSPTPDDLSQYHLDRAVDRYLSVMRIGNRSRVAAP